MDFSNSRSSSTSQRIPNRNFTFQYEPCLYCKCGLQSPLCTARDSGRKFLDVKIGRAMDVDFSFMLRIMQGVGAIEYESTKIDLMEFKRIVESLRDEVLVVQQRLGRIEEATKKINSFNSVKVVKVVGVGVVVVLAAIVWFNVRFMNKPGLACIL